MRLTLALQMVLACGLGLGLARWRIGVCREAGWIQYQIDYLLLGGDGLLAGLVATIGLGVWVEVARRRSPRAWGAGRWLLAVLPLVMLLQLLFDVLGTYLRGWVLEGWRLVPRRTPTLGSQELLREMLDDMGGRGFLDLPAVPYFVVGIMLAARFGRPSGSVVVRDAREWTGRGAGAFILVVLLMHWYRDLSVPSVPGFPQPQARHRSNFLMEPVPPPNREDRLYDPMGR